MFVPEKLYNCVFGLTPNWAGGVDHNARGMGCCRPRALCVTGG